MPLALVNTAKDLTDITKQEFQERSKGTHSIPQGGRAEFHKNQIGRIFLNVPEEGCVVCYSDGDYLHVMDTPTQDDVLGIPKGSYVEIAYQNQGSIRNLRKHLYATTMKQVPAEEIVVKLGHKPGNNMYFLR